MTRPAVPFSERLAIARQKIAAGAPQCSVHQADQYGAARDEAEGLHDRVGALLPVVRPNRPWHQKRADPAADETRAYLLAAVLGCLADVCGRRKVMTFVPFCCTLGSAILTGDACRNCAVVLGIRTDEGRSA
jgi:hypothetical protein